MVMIDAAAEVERWQGSPVLAEFLEKHMDDSAPFRVQEHGRKPAR
jgi:hypothetical protein